MISSLYTSLTGLTQNQKAMDVVGDNLANVNTTGYKAGRMVFRTCLAKHWQVQGHLQMEEEALTPSKLGWVQMWERLIRFLRKAPLVTQVL